MPLTFAHPAIILPLNYLPKRWLSLTGLIAGSVAPDFEYFTRMKILSIYSHTWLGMFWFDLPVALVICFVYHNIARKQFITNLPAPLQNRFYEYSNFNWNAYFAQNVLIIFLSILVGIASHLFWDSFTHITGYFVILWNMASPVSIGPFQLPLYKIIQHSSTFIGAIIIIIAIYQMPKYHAVSQHRIWPYWFIVSGIILITIGLRLASGLSFHQYWNILVTAISGGILGIILFPILAYYNNKVSIR